MAQVHRSNALVVPILAGLAGAGIALLFAPRSGKETRARIKLQAERLKGQTKEKATEARHKIEDKVTKARQLKGRLTEAIKSTTDETKEEAEDLREHAKESSARLRAAIRNRYEEEV